MSAAGNKSRRTADRSSPLRIIDNAKGHHSAVSRSFGTTPQFWLNLQQSHDLTLTLAEHGSHINDTVQPKAA
jgi:hypothetical protein